MKKLLIIASALVVTFSSCKKDNPAPTCNLDNNGILGNYKVTSILYKANAASPEVDIFATYDACEKDDIISFVTNGVYTVTEGATSCTPTNADSGTWSLSGSTLTLDGTDGGVVTNFSCSGFTITQTIASSGEVTKITLAKQ